jgi:DNA-binding MarR family transcriptional regulator
MSAGDPPTTITLTTEQVLEVVQHASVQTELNKILGELADLQPLEETVAPLLADLTLSRSTVRALMVLAAFGRFDEPRELTEVARELDLSPSTTHRYVRTWFALGLLNQDPASRRYRRTNRSNRAADPIEC